MSLYEELKETNFPYSPTIVRDMIDSNYKRYGYVKPVTKRIIFYMMRRIVLRGVVTFFNINKNRNNEVPHEVDDMVNEIYEVLSSCTELFDTRIKKDFYLYFSSGVSRRMSRMANYKRVNNDEVTFSKYGSSITDDEDISVEEMLEDKKVGVQRSTKEFNDYIEGLGLSKVERGVVDSIVKGRKPRDILEENDINRKMYNDVLLKLRDKLKDLI